MKTRTKIWIYPLVIMGLLLMFASGCKKDLHYPTFDEAPYLPIVTTIEASNITQTTAVSGGNIKYGVMSAYETAQGICWSDDSTIPNISYTHIFDSSGAQNFRITMTGLKPNTRYIVVAFAMNNCGIAYGAGISFNTQN